MVNFGGFEMPVYYSGIAEEHQAVRNYSGLFDVSHMGQVIIIGNDSQKYFESRSASPIARSRTCNRRSQGPTRCGPHAFDCQEKA